MNLGLLKAIGRRPRRSLVDMLSANLAKPDPVKPPRVRLTEKLHPIRHSNPN